MESPRAKALIYCRVSSERQKAEGHGLDSQEHRCREYSKAKGYEVDAVFRDSITGGGDFMKRPGMVDLLSHLDKYPHRNYVIIFDDLKRLARDTAFYLKLRQEFKARGAKVESPNFTFEDSDEAMFVETVLAAGAELERKQNRRQVIQKQKARLEAGYWPFFPPPGYYHEKDKVHGKLLVPDKKAEIISQAFEGFASLRFKDQISVQKFLRENDFCDGRYISPTTVKRLLTRPIYAGYIEYKGWEVSRRLGHHKPIISVETFNRVQERLEGKPRIFTRKDTRDDFPLRGPVLCGGCSKPLTASWSKGRKDKYAYYRCNQNNCPNKNKGIPVDVIHKHLKEKLLAVRPKKQIIDYAKAIFTECWANRLSRIETANRSKERELSDVLNQKEALIKRIPKASDTVALEYEKEIEVLAKKAEQLKEEVENPKVRGLNFETAMNGVINYIENPADKWENGSLNDKRLITKLVFTDKLLYEIGKGFGTAQLSLPMKAFEQFSNSNSQGVEMGGLNRRPKFFHTTSTKISGLVVSSEGREPEK